ncbi:MAG: iron ABC transporter permease [Gemmatimonadaceae bacterium]
MLKRGWWFWLLLSMGVTAVAALTAGAVSLAPHDVWNALQGDGDPVTIAIVRTVRLPRVALALCVGAALGMSGATLQGVLRNPLAEPYLLGVSGGAAVGAVIAVALGTFSPALVAVSAFIGALTAVAAVIGLARVSGGSGDARLLLMAGVVIGAFANATIMVVMATASPDTTRNALWWMMGSVSSAGWRDVGLLSAALLLAGAFLLQRARELDVLALGGDTAVSLGVNPERAAMRFFILASMLAAASVAAAGLVGFVGLMVPHVARSLTGGRSRPVLVASAIAGATLVALADIFARVVRAPAELPLGAITAIVGVPFFLARLRRRA